MNKQNSLPVAVVNSCQGPIVEVTILNEAKGRELDGSMVEFSVESDNRTQSVLGRMGTVEMHSLAHENKAFAPVIAARGKIDYLSGVADVHSAKVEVISAVDSNGNLGPRLIPPQSATKIYELGANGLNKYWPEQKHYSIGGHLPMHPDVPMSCINRGFGDEAEGGWGEAKHTAYFGRNGSGKTIWAMMDTACKLAANPQMGALIPDTAGDLCRDHSKGDFYFDFPGLLELANRKPAIIDIETVALSSQSVFASRLGRILLRRLSTSGEKADEVALRTVEYMFGDADVDIRNMPADELEKQLFDGLADSIAVCFTKKTLGDKQLLFDSFSAPGNHRISFMKQVDREVFSLFRGEVKISDLMKRFLNNNEVVIIKMHNIPDRDQKEVMHEIFSKAKRQTEKNFHATGETVNALIVLDEGPRWVPQDRSKQDDVSEAIIDAFNTTRKYGLGWTIISQRITAISKDVLAQCHTTWFGKGLGVGADADHIRRELGEDGWMQYQNLQLQGGFPWIGIGDAINLGVGSQYVAFTPFGGNVNDALIAANPHIWDLSLDDGL